MALKDSLLRIASYFFPIKLKSYNSQYSGELFIYKVNGKRVLDTASVNYSYNSLHKVFKTAFEHTDIRAEHVKNTLVLGLGGGSIIHLLRVDHGINSPITAVEIDPVIINIARTEFNINQYSPLNIVAEDAGKWIRENISGFDIICVDLFINAEVPSTFLNTGFIDELLRCTNQNGVIYFNIMIVNSVINLAHQSMYHYLNQSLGKTIQSVESIEVEENNRVLIIKK